MTDYTTIEMLHPADEHNVRRVRKDPTADMIASIRSKGIIQPLIVVSLGKAAAGYGVIEGERRRRAVVHLFEVGDWPKARRIPIHVVEVVPGGDSARDISLTTSVIRAGLHPVDEYEAYAALAREGKTAEAIADEYGAPLKAVRQVLALGELSPAVRDGWRAGAIKEESARLFTTLPVEAQTKLYAKLKKQGNLAPHSIRRAMHDQGQATLARKVDAVGLAVYRAAGGTLTEDLFGQGHVVHDAALAERLFDELVAETSAKLLAEGWLWVEPLTRESPIHTLGRVYGTSVALSKAEHKRLDSINRQLRDRDDDESDHPDASEMALLAEARTLQEKGSTRHFSEAEMKRAGCFVGLDPNEQGRSLRILQGYLKPAQDAARQKKKSAPGGKVRVEGSLSNALMQRLSHALTKAAGATLATKPYTALAAIVAGFKAATDWESGDGHGPVRVEAHGLVRKVEQREHTPRELKKGDAVRFPELFEANLAVSEEGLLAQLAEIAGRALDMETFHGDQPPMTKPSVAALCNALPAAEIYDSLLRFFDPADYFKAVSMKLCHQALDDCGVGRDRPKQKGILAEACVVAAKEKRWLPPQLRTALYDGPGSPLLSVVLAKGQESPQRPAKAARRAKGAPAPAKGGKPGAAKNRRLPAKSAA